MNKMVNGQIIAMTAEEIAADQQEDAWILQKTWSNVRLKRNALLAESDWRAMSDLTLSDEWKTYRQALRDITTQTDAISIAANSSVVDNIIWPDVPGAVTNS